MTEAQKSRNDVYNNPITRASVHLSEHVEISSQITTLNLISTHTIMHAYTHLQKRERVREKRKMEWF